MGIETKQLNRAPKLRFTGFSGDWDQDKLGKVFDFSSGGTPSKADARYWNGDIPWVTAATMRGHYYNDSEHKVTNIAIGNGTRLVPKGTILVLVRGSMLFRELPVGIVLKDMAFNQDIKALKPKSDTSSVFILYWFIYKKSYILSLVSGTGIGAGKLDTEDLKNLDLFIPSAKEQQKIAGFLESVDDWLDNLCRQKNAMETYRRGMMQKLLTQQVRFKDDSGKSFPEWEERELNDVGETYNGLTGKTGEDFGEGDPFITYKQIFDDIEINKVRFQKVKISSGEKQNKAQYGDIFFTTSSETPNEVGYSSVLLEKDATPYLNSFSFAFRPNSLNELTPSFAKYLFRGDAFRKDIVKLAQGSTRYNISKIGFMKINILLPAKEEQQKIADFLTSLDKGIESKQQQITKVEEWKKGLMQKMFV